MDLDISTMAQRPDRGGLWKTLEGFWPSFMTADPTGGFYYDYLDAHFPEHCLLAVDTATGEALAKAHSVPLVQVGWFV